MNKATRILLVDDDLGILQLFSEILRSEGYEVWVASTGQQGLQLTLERRPDLVLLDVMLPDISGIDVCKQIKSNPALPDVFVVLVSGLATSTGQKVLGLETGADDYVSKPLEMSEFLARIRTIVRLRDTTAALRASEQHYRRLVEILPDAVSLIDLQGRLTAANPQAAAMLGYRDEGELAQKNVFDLAQPQDRERLRIDLATVINTGMMRNAEYTLLRKNNVLFPVELSAAAVMDADGKPAGLVTVGRDITQRKWAENLLRIQRDFGIFLSSTNDLNSTMERLLAISLQCEGIDCGAVYLADLETGALHLATCQGLSEDFAKSISHFAEDSAQARLAKAGQASYWHAGEPIAGIAEQVRHENLRAAEAIPIRHGGRLVAVLNVGSHADQEIPAKSRLGIEAIAAQAGDAIARIQAEQSLRANQQLLEKTLHSLHSAVFVIDAGTSVIQETNPSATRMFGYAREEMVGRTSAVLHLNPAMSNQFKKHLLAAFKGKGFLSEFEFQMRHQDGTSFPTEHSVMPIKNEAGQLARWVSVVRDITKRKRADEALRRLPWRIIEAQEAERLRVARELHDGVNQIIASAKMRLHKVMQDGVSSLNPAAREILARCDRQLVQALEENRRIARNLRPNDLDELGLAEACRNFCKELQTRTKLNVKCSITRLSHRLPPAAELSLFRIVQEAVNNAEKYARATTIRLRIAFQGDSIVLKIQDDGHGFDVTAAKVDKRKGHGIGFTNMRERAASLGGTCEIESVPKQGTTITVRVPAKKTA